MPASADQRIEFLVALGRSLHAYGIPAHRLEDALGNAAHRLGIRAEFFSTPTSLISAFGETAHQHTVLSRIQPGALQLDKLVELDQVVEALYKEEIGVPEAARRLTAIDRAAPRFGPLPTTLAFAVVAAAACRFFGGAVPEMTLCLGLGLLTGGLAWAAERSLGVARMLEFLAALLVTFLAGAAATWWRPLAVGEAVLASLVILLPGLTLTLALNELATGHLVSGTARLTGAGMTFLKLGLGVGLGRKLADLLPGPLQEVPPPALPGWTLWPALLVTALGLVVLFRARLREAPWILVACLVAFWGARLGVGLLGAGLGAVVGALLAGAVSNLYARTRHRPAVVLVVPSVILLVPGSIGYHSLTLLMANDVTSGVGVAFTALLVGVSLVAGLLLANVVVPPRNAL